jgi:hypothetical protein
LVGSLLSEVLGQFLIFCALKKNKKNVSHLGKNKTDQSTQGKSPMKICENVTTTKFDGAVAAAEQNQQQNELSTNTTHQNKLWQTKR